MSFDGTFSRIIVEVRGRFALSPHGRAAAPRGIGDHIIVIASVIIVIVCVYLCIRYFVLPRERDEDHIKNRILKDDFRALKDDDEG